MKNLEKLRNRYATMSLYNLTVGDRLASVFDVVRENYEFADMVEEFNQANGKHRIGLSLPDAFEGSEAGKCADFMNWVQQIRNVKTQKQAHDFILQELRGFDPQDWRQASTSEFFRQCGQRAAPIWVIGAESSAVTDVATWIGPSAQSFVGENFETMSLNLRRGKIKIDKPTCAVFVAKSSDDKAVITAVFEFTRLSDWPHLEYSLLLRLGYNWRLENTGSVPRWAY